jgi:uncharacterized FlaG/YvyC family protein
MIDYISPLTSPAATGAVATKLTPREAGVPQAAKPETARPVAPAGNSEALKQLEEEINGAMDRLLASNLRLRIEADTAAGAYVYKGIDRDTGEVKKQWPPEKILSLRAFLRALDGVLVDETA